MFPFFPDRERDAVSKRSRAGAPVEAVDDILIATRYVQGSSVRTECNPEKHRGEWNRLKHSPGASIYDLYSLLSPSIEQHDDAVFFGRKDHRQGHRTEIVRHAGRIEPGSGRKSMRPRRLLRHDIATNLGGS